MFKRMIVLTALVFGTLVGCSSEGGGIDLVSPGPLFDPVLSVVSQSVHE